jgi:hypothetical protein
MIILSYICSKVTLRTNGFLTITETTFQVSFSQIIFGQRTCLPICNNERGFKFPYTGKQAIETRAYLVLMG